MNNFLTFRTETTPDGVSTMYRSNDGATECAEAVSYIGVINRPSAGGYDGKPDEDTSIHLAIADGGNQGYFDYTPQHSVITWKWLVATAFMLEMKKESGTVSITDNIGNPSEVTVYSNDIVATSLYPVAERLAMVSNIEDVMIERFDIESDTERAIILYRAMMDMEQGVLTPFGRETLVELHNSFMAELNGNGMSARPVTH